MCKEKDLRKRTWSVRVCVCVHVCVRKRTFHVCVFQEERMTRITLMYQVDVCVDVDVCVLMCVDVCARKRISCVCL